MNNKKSEINNKNLVIKSNRLIEGRHELSLVQSKIIAYACATIPKECLEFFTITFQASKLLKDLNMERNNFSFLRRELKNLMQKIISIGSDNFEDWLDFTVLSHTEYIKKNDTIEVKFNEKMTPFLLDLKKNYTKLSLPIYLQLTSQYSIKFYELFQLRIRNYIKYKNKDILTFTYDTPELRELLLGKEGSKNKYKNYTDFKKYCIVPAFKELKEKLKIQGGATENKIRRKIVSLTFEIYPISPYIAELFNEKSNEELQKQQIKKKTKNKNNE